MKPEEHARKVTKIIAKAWMDKGFKARLLSDPMATLKEEGVEIPPGVEVRIAVDTDKIPHLLLPMKPAGEALSDAQLGRRGGRTARHRRPEAHVGLGQHAHMERRRLQTGLARVSAKVVSARM
jgi:hypothetical protein